MRSPFFGENTVSLWIALLAYLALHATMQLYWAGLRPSPVEPDDAYTYILKAAQVSEGCGLQRLSCRSRPAPAADAGRC